MTKSRINELQDRHNTVLGRIKALKDHKRIHGACDERSLRLHYAESSRLAAQIAAETRSWDAANPARVRSARSAPTAGSAPRPRLTRDEFMDGVARVVEGDTSHVEYRTLRDLALRDIEKRSLPPATADRLDHLVRTRHATCDGKLVARHLLVTGSAAYADLFRTALTHETPALTGPMVAAAQDYQDLQASIAHRAHADEASRFAAGEVRAMSEGTDSAGGFAVPYFLDPTLIAISGLAAAQIADVSKTVITTSNAWHGFVANADGFTTKSEGAAASEDDPVFEGPNVPLYLGSDWLPFSIELGMDQPNWVDNATELFASSYKAFVANRTTVGSGSGNPTGIFTRMANTTTNPPHATVMTAGELGAVDVRAVWLSLPERFRVDPSCCWVMAPSVEARLSALSGDGALSPSDLTTDPATGQRRLFGRPILSAADAPSLTATTGAANYCVVGAFSRFVTATRLGSFQIELVPNVPNFSNGGRPSGKRGFLATVRFGCDVIDPRAFYLVSNT